jgi:hypothetical protein
MLVITSLVPPLLMHSHVRLSLFLYPSQFAHRSTRPIALEYPSLREDSLNSVAILGLSHISHSELTVFIFPSVFSLQFRFLIFTVLYQTIILGPAVASDTIGWAHPFIPKYHTHHGPSCS